MAKPVDDQRWVWKDLEMTGLDDKTCAIIQAAVIITDGQLNELTSRDIVIWQPESVLESMSPFVRKMHTDNGLLDRVRASQTSLDEAESAMLSLILEYVPYRKGILAGNSIWQDRRFLLRYMPLLEKALHYRQIDVSSMKVVLQHWFGGRAMPPPKASKHTALEDIRASIEELKFYRQSCMLPGS